MEAHVHVLVVDGRDATHQQRLGDAAEAHGADPETEAETLDAAVDVPLRGLHASVGEDTEDVPLHLGLRGWHVLRAVHVVEVHRVDGVLGHLLVARLDRPATDLEVRPLFVAHAVLGAPLGDFVGQTPLRRKALIVIPHDDQPGERGEGPGANRQRARRPDVRAQRVERVSLRANDRLVDDGPAEPEMRAASAAVSLERGELSRRRPDEHELSSEVLQRKQLPRGDVGLVPDLEPAVGDAGRVVAAHREDDDSAGLEKLEHVPFWSESGAEPRSAGPHGNMARSCVIATRTFSRLPTMANERKSYTPEGVAPRRKTTFHLLVAFAGVPGSGNAKRP